MIPHNRVVLTLEDKAAVSRVLDSGYIGQGSEVAAFEYELADRFRPDGAAVCVSSGTAAIRLAAIALNMTETTIPTYACSALYHAVNDGIGTVALLDCDPETFNTPLASIAVATYGVPCVVMETAIEDFTHSAGGEAYGRICGSFGAASVISFGATKPLGCGVGGAVLGSQDMIEAIRDMRDYDGKHTMRECFNWQMGDVTAALGRSRLARLDDEVLWRRLTAARYTAICEARGIKVHGAGSSHMRPTAYRFVMRVADPMAVKRHFAAADIEVINPLEPWELLHRQLCLDPDEFSGAEEVAASTISLPIWPAMTPLEVDAVCHALERLRVAA